MTRTYNADNIFFKEKRKEKKKTVTPDWKGSSTTK